MAKKVENIFDDFEKDLGDAMVIASDFYNFPVPIPDSMKESIIQTQLGIVSLRLMKKYGVDRLAGAVSQGGADV